MNRRVAVVLLTGLPGSGKTTLCQQLLRRHPRLCRHVCFDDLLHPDDLQRWRASRDQVLGQVETVIKNFIASEDKGRLVILVDDNFYYQSMRRMFFKMARKLSVVTCVLILNCNEDLAIKRVQERAADGGLFVDEQVIREMSAKMEPPAEDNWEKFYITIDSEEPLDIDKIWTELEKLIEAASGCEIFHKPVENVDAQPHQPSEQQNRDLLLRKFISAEMQQARKQGLSPAELSELANRLNSERKLFLKSLSFSKDSPLVDQFRNYLEKSVL
ncbi:L-seryl-tRNA(Sec) kinase [Neocloeon triangulifer]|uniref:L-seryl-tRNA(Sec) kinase n=1 Tax=Neocloeon triangulifer TaxID=2078957 RepID=UPI00286F9C86|nr:L-seryl-tRNA(Sec) kinase [Neocloeon triangulifer]